MSAGTAAALPGGMRQPAGAEAPQSRLLYELCALLLTILRSPAEDGAGARPRHVTPAGVASMLLGASMTLMLGGSVTFMLGFFLMPWVLGLGCVFLFVGFVTNLSEIGRTILLWPAAASSPMEASPLDVIAIPKKIGKAKGQQQLLPVAASQWHIFYRPSFSPM